MLQSHTVTGSSPGIFENPNCLLQVYRWLLTIAAGAVTGLVATGINLGVKILGHLKYNWTFDAIRNHMDQLEKNDTSMSGASDPYHPPFWYPFFTFVSISVLYISVATVLVSCVEPVARGSGIPEIKCYLNGVNIPRVVRQLTQIGTGQTPLLQSEKRPPFLAVLLLRTHGRYHQMTARFDAPGLIGGLLTPVCEPVGALQNAGLQGFR